MLSFSCGCTHNTIDLQFSDVTERMAAAVADHPSRTDSAMVKVRRFAGAAHQHFHQRTRYRAALNTSTAPIRKSLARAMQRFREVIHDVKTTFRKQLAALKARREKAALFRDVREAKAAADASATDTLLRERGSLVQSNKAVEEMLAQAAATRENLARQRSTLQGAMGGIGDLMGRLPAVGAIIGAIQSRRIFNDRVVAAVAAVCLCFFIWFFVLRRS